MRIVRLVRIPNPENGGRFDGFGQYINPWQFAFNTQIGYDFSRTIRANLLLSNLVATCFGGSSTPWSRAYKPSRANCTYVPLTVPGGFVSNFFNGSSPNDVAANGVPLPALFAHAYGPTGSAGNPQGFFPFNMYFQLQFKM